MTVTYDYAGKVVLVTGGTRGIGAGIATAFAAAGAEVIVCARRDPIPPPQPEPRPEPAGAPPVPPPSSPPRSAATGVRFVRADVRDADDLKRLFSGLDRLDVVVNNAGGSPYAPLDGTSPRLQARIVELNLIAPLLVAQRAYPLLAASGGSIVMIGSSSGGRPSPGTSAYGAAKAGLHHLANCLAAEWAPGVRVNTVVVGLAATEDSIEHYGGKDVGTAVPAGRMATPADVASVCLWLAEPGYVTGAQVHVHGGGEIPAWQHLASDDIS